MEAHNCVYKVIGKLPIDLCVKQNRPKKVFGSTRLDECVHSYVLYYTANTVIVLKISALLFKVAFKVDCKIVHILA